MFYAIKSYVFEWVCKKSKHTQWLEEASVASWCDSVVTSDQSFMSKSMCVSQDSSLVSVVQGIINKASYTSSYLVVYLLTGYGPS